jgi:hypothetical protein
MTRNLAWPRQKFLVGSTSDKKGRNWKKLYRYKFKNMKKNELLIPQNCKSSNNGQKPTDYTKKSSVKN